MVSLFASAVVALLLLILYSLLAPKSSNAPRGTRLPPGPPGKPLVGNLLDIPSKHSWLTFKKWADHYGGPLLRLNIAGREHYVVSTEKVANDLLRERGNIYSSREQLPAAAVLLGDNLRPLLLPYNDVWRRGRKLMHQLTMPSAATSYEPTQILESTRLLHDLINSPTDYEHIFEHYSSGLIFRLGFGKRIQTGHEAVVQRIFAVDKTIERVASPGAYLVDTFPALMHLPTPLAPFKQELQRLHKEELSLFRELLNDVRTDMATGTAPDCWEKTFLEQRATFNLTDDQGAYVIGTLFEAGAGTTAAAMMSFVLAMVHHPAWLHAMQTELDRVVGAARLPEFSDMAQLPTVRACIKETLRWRPVTAGGLPHQLTTNDDYQGLFLPAGTNVHANQWAIHREPALYPDPETFNPARWLEVGYPTFREPLTQYPNLQNFSAFGFGRRICPGMNIAERSLNILTARIAWACDISKTRDGRTGEEIQVPLYDYTSGFNVQPKPFAFALKARSRERAELVRVATDEEMAKDPLR